MSSPPTRMNCSTEHVHHWINSAPGIFCENHQNDWEQSIQVATYVHNISPIPGSKELSSFFLGFGRDVLSPDTISLQLPKENVSADLYASHLLHRLKSARTEYEQIKADLKDREENTTMLSRLIKSSLEINVCL